MNATLTPVRYSGHEAVRLDLGVLRVVVAVGFGPRILGLEAADSGNLLAVLPDAELPTGDGRVYRFRGGHRLWVAPERPTVTYAPDDEPVAIDELPAGLAVTAPADPRTGIGKRIEIVARSDGSVLVRHVVRNEGDEPRRHAAWAITQLPAGGVARLPLRPAGPVPTGDARLLPDRLLVAWPYTSLDDVRLRVGDDAVEVSATPAAGDELGPLKVGTRLVGPLAYVRRGWALVKSAAGGDEASVDFGARAQVYCDGRFLELETLGPLVDLAPGASVVHDETWEVRPATGSEPAPA